MLSVGGRPRLLRGRPEYGSIDAFIATSRQADHEQQEHDGHKGRGHGAKASSVHLGKKKLCI